MLNKIFESIGTIGGIIDDLHTSGEEKRAAKLEEAMVQLKANIAQMEINKEEAKSQSLFVAGWRPFIGWICGTALAYSFILLPILNWIGFTFLTGYSEPPALELGPLMTILMGMLGLAGMRTYEKTKGVARENWKED